MEACALVVLDPTVLALGLSAGSQEAAEAFIDGINAWAGARRGGACKLLIADCSIAGLIAANLYPYDYSLVGRLKAHGVDKGVYRDICDVVRSLLRSPRLEDELDCEEVACSPGGTRVLPTALVDRSPALPTGGTLGLLEMLLAFSNDDGTPPRGIALATVPVDGWPEPVPVEVKSIVESVVARSSQAAVPGIYPRLHACSTLGFYSLDVLLERIGLDSLWGAGDSETRATECIEVFAGQLERQQATGNRGRSDFRLGPGFLGSAKKWGFRGAHASLLVEACGRVVCDCPKNEVLPFRTGKETTDPQRRRDDGALAFRTHLSKSGPGYRLMFWRLPSGTIEFANVGDKDELVIL